jgi:hypothetical protein
MVINDDHHLQGNDSITHEIGTDKCFPYSMSNGYTEVAALASSSLWVSSSRMPRTAKFSIRLSTCASSPAPSSTLTACGTVSTDITKRPLGYQAQLTSYLSEIMGTFEGQAEGDCSLDILNF